MSHLMLRYLIGSTTFAGGYKTAILWDAELPIDRYDKYGKKRPMFMGEKIAVFSMSIMYSPVGAPYWLCKMIDRVDMQMRNLNPHEIGYERSCKGIIDYIIA